jgi:glycosyltransferase involved in cell wall biosynthesis
MQKDPKMNKKQRLAIVAGDIEQPRFLLLFEALKSHFDLTLFVLGDESIATNFESSIKCRLYSPVADMPGYMRDLESDLATMDGIIGIDTTKISTFQAVRTARKNRIPVFVVVTESQPLFYEKYPNIKAIQYDICNTASYFWATSQAAKDTLIVEGVASEKIGLVKPNINNKRFKVSDHLRQKFRTYVGLRQEDIVVLCRGDLEPHNNLFSVLDALRLLRQQGIPSSLRTKVLFCGDGSISRDLKIKAADLGIGSQVLFLHQDPEPFLPDLFNASDFYLVAGTSASDRAEPFPMSLLEAMGCGMIPIVPAGSVAAELCADHGFHYNSSHLSSLVMSLFHAVHTQGNLDMQKAMISNFTLNLAVRSSSTPNFSNEVLDQMKKSAANIVTMTSPAEILRSIANDVESGNDLDALVKVEEAELQGFETVSCLAELSCLKGEALYNIGRMEEAMNAYSVCMQIDPNNPRCLRGLGFIAWHGHSNEEALTFFKKALAVHENDLLCAYGIGLVYRRLGLLDEAMYWLESCVLKSKKPTSAVIALAQTCSQLIPRSRGIAALERAMDVVGDHHALLATLGQLYLADGQLEEGKQLLEKAMQSKQGHAA